jgi:alkylation response protein AidB-like acyl-CoA dehydrogenase
MSTTTTTVGAAFLCSETAPEAMFTPEDFGADARLMAETAAQFLATEVMPKIEQIEAHDTALMEQLMRGAGALGLLGADVPEVYGGLGLDMPTCALLAETLNPQQSFALSHEAHTVIATLPLMFFGTHAQKQKYLPKLASGEWIGSFCLSESGSGSDALGAKTRAALSEDGTHWVLNGEKMWITNTAFADLFTVFAKVDGEKFTAFLVERGFPGISFGREEHKLGMKGTSTRRVILENCLVPRENQLGEIGKGHYAAFCALNLGRFKLEAGAVGGIKYLLQAAAQYAAERHQFGRPLSSFGQVRAKVGEMTARLFALESAVYRLAGDMEAHFSVIDPTAPDASAAYHRAAEEFALECGIVKVFGSELYSWAADEAIQIHGGNGYTEEFPVARAWRDQRLLRIGEGANEIVRVNIITTLLRRASAGRVNLQQAVTSARAGRGALPLEMMHLYLSDAALLLLDVAHTAFGDGLLEEQEVAAVIADCICAAYVCESAWMRARKLRDSGRNPQQAELAAQAAHVVTGRSMLNLHGQAAEVLDRIPGEFHNAETSRLVSDLFLWGRHDLIGLRRSISDAVFSRGRYPW